MKQYVTVAKGIYEPHDWFILDDEINANDCPFKTKKIHIKHKHILDVYMKDNNIEIEELISDKPNEHWQNIQDGYAGIGKNFIDLYKEDTEYRLKQKEKPKNNFKEYGFEADFEGEILGVRHGYMLGWFREPNGKIFHGMWDENGYNKCSSVGNAIYDTIKPIKKEWFENPDNFPCMLYKNSTNKLHLAYLYNETEKNLKFESFSDAIYKYRPATKEEVLSLLVKE